MNNFIDMGGTMVPLSELITEKSKELAIFINSTLFEYVELIECRIDNENNSDIVVFDIQVELAQRQVYDIKPKERIACIFPHNDDAIPIVYALRDDFPLTPHINQMSFEYPRCLCIYEENYEDLKISWSTPELIIRIGYWLSRTSMGILHSPDQPLEPLLFAARDSLVLPKDYGDKFEKPQLYKFVEVESANERKVYFALPFDSKIEGELSIAITIIGKPLQHGIIRKLPDNLYELSQFLEDTGINLIDELVHQCKGILGQDVSASEYKTYKFVLIFGLPKVRKKGGEIENIEVRAFMLMENIMQIGTRLGVWKEGLNGIPGLMMPPKPVEGQDLEIPLQPLNVHEPFTKKLAARVNGYNSNEIKIVMVGAGALGSHLLNNLARSGFGKWTIIDNDDLFPHNLGRHVLGAQYIGFNKAISLSKHINSIFQDDIIAEGIAANVMKPEANASIVNEALKNANIILDVSTSVAVERYIALDIKSEARRISAFLNPAGTDLVLLIEDVDRNVSLDFLEVLYYRNILNTSDLENHLKLEQGNIRYANSCRDISNRIPEDYVNMLSAICSAYLHKIESKGNAEIHIWQIEPESLFIRHHDITVYGSIYKGNYSGWDIFIDEYLIDKVNTLRDKKLPVETGGVLIGSYDMKHKIIYIIDTIPSPPDSIERPISYIRGCVGLADKVNKIKSLTQNKLEYVGEWHSHPKGISGNPSEYDDNLLEWVSNLMKYDGHPGLMIICHDDGVNIYVK